MFAEDIRKASPETEIAIGFGVSSSDDAQKVCALADYAVVGSAWLRAYEEGEFEALLKSFSELRSRSVSSRQWALPEKCRFRDALQK